MPRQLAMIVGAARQHVEGVELCLVIVLARVQRSEVRFAIRAEHHRLAVDHELLLVQLERGLDD